MGPLPFLRTDRFESWHQHFKKIRGAKRTSVNVLKTLIINCELASVYNSTGETMQSEIEMTVQKKCTDELVLKFLETVDVPGGVLYECKKLTVFGTSYKKDQFLILPEATNDAVCLGRIEKLLSCTECGYVVYEKTLCEYQPEIDLYMVTGLGYYSVVPLYQLPDPIPLQGYAVGVKKTVSVSLRRHILQHV